MLFILKGVSIFLLTYRTVLELPPSSLVRLSTFFWSKECRCHSSPGPSISTLSSLSHRFPCAAHISSDSKSCCLCFLKDSCVCPPFVPAAKILSCIRLIITSCFSFLYFSVFIRLLYSWFSFFGKNKQFKPIIIFSLSFSISKTCSQARLLLPPPYSIIIITITISTAGIFSLCDSHFGHLSYKGINLQISF